MPYDRAILGGYATPDEETANPYQTPLKTKILEIDSLAGLTAGLAVLSMTDWLVRWYQLPRDLLLFLGIMNLLFGTYSGTLVLRGQRSKILILGLVLANSMWAVSCLWWGARYAEEASALGLAHLAGEALFVGSLAFLEWRWREELVTKRPS